MLCCILLITCRLLLSSVDGLQVDNPPSTAPTAPPPPSCSSSPATITEPPSTAALIPVFPRLFLPSTGKPVQDGGCTHTKRVPSRPPDHSNGPAIDTATSYVNCKGCNAVTTIPMQLDTPDRPGVPVQWRATATGSGAIPSAATRTTTVYRCSTTPTPMESSRTIPPLPPPPPPPRAVSNRRTRPVQPTLVES